MIKKSIYFGHIRIIIQSDCSCDNGKQHYNSDETMLYTTMRDDEIRAIFLEDDNFHKLVIRKLEQFIEEYKEKWCKNDNKSIY